jgi:hypothetical protein
LLECVVWRVVALATPAWIRGCSRCAESSAHFAATERFRVNASQGRLDVWLLYACACCGATEKRRLLRRVPVAAIEPERLDGYHRNDAQLAWTHAFELPLLHELPQRVERPPLPATGTVTARIEQPYPCGARWDRLLARELGWSRSRTVAAWRSAAISIDGAGSLAERVGRGQRLCLTLGPAR